MMTTLLLMMSNARRTFRVALQCCTSRLISGETDGLRMLSKMYLDAAEFMSLIRRRRTEDWDHMLWAW